MDRSQLLQHFDTLAELPGAIDKLRELVREFGVSGRLSDPATNWQKDFLGDALESIQTGPFGSTLHKRDYVEGGTPVVNPASLRDGKIVPIDRMAVNEKTLQRMSSWLLQRDDVVIARRGEMGRSAVVTEREAGWLCGTGSAVLRPSKKLAPEYLQLVLSSPKARAYLNDSSVGTTMSNLNQGVLQKMSIRFPPVSEQRRIVTKVEELLALCDELEARQTVAREYRTRLVRSALDHLTTAKDEADFRKRSNFVLQHSDFILEDVPALRQAILSLAVQGKLVPQDVESPFGTLDSILAEASVNGVSKGPTSDMSATEILRISAGTARGDFYVNEDDFKHVDLPASEVEKFRLAPGDLLACRFNGNLHYVGRFSLYRGESGRVQVNPDKLIRFRVDTKRNSPRYICYTMNAAPIRAAIESMSSTTAGNIGLSAGRLKTVEIPLPPLAEQQRIVAKVDELLRWCDALEARLTAARTTATHLLDATLHQILAA